MNIIKTESTIGSAGGHIFSLVWGSVLPRAEIYLQCITDVKCLFSLLSVNSNRATAANGLGLGRVLTKTLEQFKEFPNKTTLLSKFV